MILDLHVRNLAVLAEASVEFGPGLNVLTGETGAGKSIVVDALSLLAGARASSDQIRSGSENLVVTGVFEPAGDAWRSVLAAAGVETAENELVIRREITRSGRNRVFVNDQPVTLGLLSELSTALIRIHTQREELGLLSPELQREWLDVAGGQEAVALLRPCGKNHADYRALAQRLERAQGDDRLRTERMDLLRFQIGEIDAGRLEVGEDESLRSERGLLRHSEAIRTALGDSWTTLFEEEGSAAERMARAGRSLEGIVDWEPSAREWSRQIEQLSGLDTTRDNGLRRIQEGLREGPYMGSFGLILCL